MYQMQPSAPFIFSMTESSYFKKSLTMTVSSLGSWTSSGRLERATMDVTSGWEMHCWRTALPTVWCC